MKTMRLAGFVLGFMASIGTGVEASVIIRVNDEVQSHCIDASSEDVTIRVLRMFTQKREGFFTEDKRAGVLVTAKLTGRGLSSEKASGTVDVQVPSVNLVSLSEENKGRVSLPLEYSIASGLTLKQPEAQTTNLQLAIYLAKTSGKNSFGETLDLAGNALSKLPIPSNPYTSAASKFLQFANEAVSRATAAQQNDPFAGLSLDFNVGRQDNLRACESAGKERTGAIAIVQPGDETQDGWIPMSNADQRYCFSYSSENTFELLAAKKVNGACPERSAYQAIKNNYVMMLISALPTVKEEDSGTSGGWHAAEVSFPPQKISFAIEEAKQRCKKFRLPSQACGLHL